MRVVTNTSPLQYLSISGHLDLLERLYGQVTVPQSVVDELLVGRVQGYDVPDCREHSWMRIESVAVPSLLKLVTNLGAGEAEALALSLAVPTDLVLLDDGLARQVAASQGIRFTGTFGVLIEAKTQGLILEVMPLVDRIQKAGFRMTESLYSLVRRTVNE